MQNPVEHPIATTTEGGHPQQDGQPDMINAIPPAQLQGQPVMTTAVMYNPALKAYQQGKAKRTHLLNPRKNKPVYTINTQSK